MTIGPLILYYQIIWLRPKYMLLVMLCFVVCYIMLYYGLIRYFVEIYRLIDGLVCRDPHEKPALLFLRLAVRNRKNLYLSD